MIKEGERYEDRAHQPNGDEMESEDDIHSSVPVPQGGKHLEHIVNKDLCSIFQIENTTVFK